jgi:predicted N-acetyltransferase YhbS
MDRPYAGAADLQLLEDSLALAYASTSLRVGDLSWMSRDHTHRELSLDIRLWEDNATRQLIAWAFFRPNGEFNVFVTPDSGHAEDASLFDSLLAFIDQSAQSSVTAGDPPVTLNTYAIDPTRSVVDRSLAAALERAGHQVDDASDTSGFLVRSLDHLSPATLPAGYNFAWVGTPALLTGRVEAHRAAFAPSDLTVKRYERVQRTWAYQPTLDRLVVTEAGEVVAFCTAWYDAHNAAGLLEPVGTHPAHQRRGLARAVCLDACHALLGMGARTAQVGYGSAAGFATYTSAGFRQTNRELVFSKPWRSP